MAKRYDASDNKKFPIEPIMLLTTVKVGPSNIALDIFG